MHQCLPPLGGPQIDAVFMKDTDFLPQGFWSLITPHNLPSQHEPSNPLQGEAEKQASEAASLILWLQSPFAGQHGVGHQTHTGAWAGWWLKVWLSSAFDPNSIHSSV